MMSDWCWLGRLSRRRVGEVSFVVGLTGGFR
jgi:hypothetical protein